MKNKRARGCRLPTLNEALCSSPPSTRNSTAGANSNGEAVVDAIRHLLTRHSRPVLIAIDGASGSRKSTLAFWVANQFEAALIQSDDFFAVGVSNAAWDARTPKERAADTIDWQRVRVEAADKHFWMARCTRIVRYAFS